MFSPYYARARRRPGGADPLDHCAINVALYGKGGARWSMTERTRNEVERSATHLRIGRSALEWTDGGLRLHIDERAAPIPRHIRGDIQVTLAVRPGHGVALDAAGRHRWGVIAPQARITVRLDAPGAAWSGSAYLDSNRGSVPLESDFVGWDWSRAHLSDGGAAVIYDIDRRDGSRLVIADRFDDEGGVHPFEAPPVDRLPRTRWGLGRSTRSEPSMPARVERSFEDGPFYARSVVSAHWLGEPVTTVHEHLSMARFERGWVRALLPFRMPRNAF